jgi:hypothetical protein
MKISLSKGLKDTLGFKNVTYKKDTSASTGKKTPTSEYKDLALDAIMYSKHGEAGLKASSKQLEAQISGTPAKSDLLDPRIKTVRSIAKKSGTGAKSTANILAYAKAEADKLR